tara:strand:+ start:1146 stop:2072 length:927 start_codon:yes stop_codon:yes gene_type:complete
MKKKIYFLLLTLIFLYCTTIANSKNSNDIIAKIGNEIITEFEVKNKILTTLFLSNQQITQKNINDLKQQSFELLLQNRLKKIELSKFNYVINNNQVNEYLKSITSLNSLNLKKKFIENNLDYELFIEEIQTDLKWQKLILKNYSSKIKIDDFKIDKEIQEILKKSIYQEFKLSEIEILSSDEISDNKKLEIIRENILLDGFENTAIKFSISNSSLEKGDIGWISSKQFSKNIFDKIKNLKIGEITEPIKNQNSFLILKLQDKRKISSDSINYNELKKNLINQERNKLFNLYSRSYISKLKNKTFIKYK